MTKYQNIYEKILDASEVLKDIKHFTRMDHSTTFSKMTGGNIYLKLENLQKTGSFKVRGAAYAISKLTDTEKSAGVIAASAGNHAQGVAYAAQKLGIDSTIVMPIFSPVSKIQATRGYGAEVILHGSTFDDALAYAQETAAKTGATFIHPFNDENVIAGQGTIGLEIINSLPSVEVVAVPVGGGGLVSGIAIAMKEVKPSIEIYGVEAQSAAAMKASLIAGEISELTDVDTICDGIAVKKPGNLTFNIAKDLLDGVVTVDEFQVTRTLYYLLERSKIVVEPAGCVGLTAYLQQYINIDSKTAVAVISGGNIDMSFMSRLVEKERFRLGQSVRVRGVISDRVGSLNKVLGIVAESRINVLSVDQDRLDPDIVPNKLELELVLEVQDKNSVTKLLDKLEDIGLKFNVFED